MAKRLPRPADAIGLRLDWSAENMTALDMAAASSGLSVASFARLALELLVLKKAVSLDDVKAEAVRLTTAGAAVEPDQAAQPAGKKGRGAGRKGAKGPSTGQT